MVVSRRRLHGEVRHQVLMELHDDGIAANSYKVHRQSPSMKSMMEAQRRAKLTLKIDRLVFQGDLGVHDIQFLFGFIKPQFSLS